MISDLPAAIRRHILEKVNDHYETRDNRLYITDLVGCLRRAYYKRRAPRPIALESAWNIYRGKVFDELWTPRIPRNQQPCGQRLIKRPTVIAGRVDFFDDDGAVADLKTIRTLRWLDRPKPEHVAQVKLYAWMTAAPAARLYYIDFGDARRFDVPLGNLEPFYRAYENIAGYLYDCLSAERVPATKRGWLCRNCENREICESER